MEKYDVNVSIVPVGLNYFRGHRFRGRVVVEFGTPLSITPDMLKLYKESKKKGYQELLSQVESGMKSVIVTANDYGELKDIHTARRLYQRSTFATSTNTKQDLAKRFSIGYSMICSKYHNRVHNPNKDPHHHTVCNKNCIIDTLPEEITDLMARLEEYQNILDDWGLKDYQVNSLNVVNRQQMLYTFMHALSVMMLASIPSVIINAPVGFAARLYATSEAKKDLAASRVKLAARDVILSKKIVFAILATPVLLVVYAVLLRLLTSLETRTILVLVLCCPLFSYVGVIGVQAGMVDFNDLRPAFLRLLPGFKTQAERLPAMRASLQLEVRRLVKKYGSELGPLYYEKDLDLVEFSAKRMPVVISEWQTEYERSLTADPGAATSPIKIEAPAIASGEVSEGPPSARRRASNAKLPEEIESVERNEGPLDTSSDYALPYLPVIPEFDVVGGAVASGEEPKKTK